MTLVQRIRRAPWILALLLIFFFILSWLSLEAPIVPEQLHRFRPSAQLAAAAEDVDTSSFRKLVRTLYKPTQAIDGTTFRDYAGTEWGIQGEPLWTKPLGKRLCIIDIDTRPLDKEGEIMDENPLNWDKTHPLAAGMLNHYMYAMIHGYEYYFIRTDKQPDRAPFWTKPSALSRILKSHDVCISIDADAVFTHLSLPFEWLLNRWRVVPEKTSLAMALDPDRSWNKDSYGKVVNNAGFVVAQNLPRTHDMLAAWTSCPDDEVKYPNCSHWKNPWPAEQRAFADYIRYEFDQEHDVKDIPCAEGNGYPESGTECKGQFVRHFWLKKGELLKPGVSASLAQAMLGLAHESFIARKEEIVVKDEPGKASQEKTFS
ncbi:hypothetical protein NA57DRAFT_63856 [Rhizodiscina lignyota]|uniref:Nucleotide-diphospho-sugar transferase domain-containing protein n=1 Tax=Rhizodiscina lignyota TaxID=1504668 RepID=A0A9P4MAH7_9PEZI|nr:hypothetical protein NA57DRAFT_63856 [Rhizodiscina lignyota]